MHVGAQCMKGLFEKLGVKVVPSLKKKRYVSFLILVFIGTHSAYVNGSWKVEK